MTLKCCAGLGSQCPNQPSHAVILPAWVLPGVLRFPRAAGRGLAGAEGLGRGSTVVTSEGARRVLWVCFVLSLS